MHNMANPSIIICLYIFITFIPTLTTSCDHPKSMKFTLYQHDIINKTDFLIIPSPFGTNITETTSPFGTIALLKDKLTRTPDPSSKVIGNVESVAITSSFDGLDSLSIGRIRLDLENGCAGSISILGVVNAVKRSDNPIVGGTGDFLFVQGFVTASPVSFDVPTYVYKQEFRLFWPPYVV